MDFDVDPFEKISLAIILRALSLMWAGRVCFSTLEAAGVCLLF